MKINRTKNRLRQSFSPCKKPLIQLQILHSPFCLLPSAFLILHSPFSILNLIWSGYPLQVLARLAARCGLSAAIPRASRPLRRRSKARASRLARPTGFDKLSHRSGVFSKLNTRPTGFDKLSHHLLKKRAQGAKFLAGAKKGESRKQKAESRKQN
ncbi:MAG: hypothetical protein LBJ60_03285 [Tannerellaceae bacterium]|nr:hypothetical protein [Tannerellaceae bacterium]